MTNAICENLDYKLVSTAILVILLFIATKDQHDRASCLQTPTTYLLGNDAAATSSHMLSLVVLPSGARAFKPNASI